MSEENKDYARGYAAGRRHERRAEREEADRQREHELRMARYALAAAIAPEVIRSPWQDGAGKKLNTAAGVAGTIADLMRAIEQRMP